MCACVCARTRVVVGLGGVFVVAAIKIVARIIEALERTSLALGGLPCKHILLGIIVHVLGCGETRTIAGRTRQRNVDDGNDKVDR